MKKCSGGTGQRPLSAMWMYNLLMGCIVSLSATRKQCKEKMYPTNCHYLFNIAEDMQFQASRCAQGDSGQKTAVDILNATLILLNKESTWYDKQQSLAWNHGHVLTPKGMELMEEAFNNVNVQDFKVHLTKNKNEHTAIVSKKSTSHREFSVNLPKSTKLGSRFGKCTCGFSKKEGIPCQHMLAVCKLGRIDGLSRSAIMPHWYTTAQWCNQLPKNSYIDTPQTLKSIKANSTQLDICINARTGWGPIRRVVQRRRGTRRVLLTMASNLQRRSAGQLQPPKLQWRRELIWKVRM
jgi:hypothetical protein